MNKQEFLDSVKDAIESDDSITDLVDYVSKHHPANRGASGVEQFVDHWIDVADFHYDECVKEGEEPIADNLIYVIKADLLEDVEDTIFISFVEEE